MPTPFPRPLVGRRSDSDSPLAPPTETMPLERYRSLIPDFERFLDTVQHREPTVIRIRDGRIAPDRLLERLGEKGFTLEQIEGLPGLRRVTEGPYPISKTLEHWLGLFYIQQASTATAAPLLGARPGERILDMCAAPGGKTTHLADLMNDRGCLVAADMDENRLRALLGNVYRLVHPGVMTLSADAREFPAGALFDRILIDVPCSAEGTLRRKRGRLRRQGADFSDYISGVQEAILRRALELVKPGGEILYSTCTFAPEENEAVLSGVLHEGAAELIELDPDFPHAHGVTRWEGQRYHDSLEGAVRVYPHQLDSGGLFLAKLRRPESSGSGDDSGSHAPPVAGDRPSRDDGGWSPVPPLFPGDEGDPDEARRMAEDGVERIREEFGVPSEAFEGIGWFVRGDNVWMHGLRAWPWESWTPSGSWRLLSVGVRAFSPGPRGRPRPTNDLFRWLGESVRSRRVEMEGEALTELLTGAFVEPPEGAAEMRPGFVGISGRGDLLGRGSIGAKGVRSEIPKAQAKALRQVLAETGD